MSSTIAFELGPRQLLDQMLRPAGIRRNERQIDLRLHRGRKLNLRPLGRVAQTLQSHLVALAAQVEPFVFLELVNQPVDHPLVEVVAAQVRVAIGGLHFNHALADFEHRDVKSPAAEVVHGDRLVFRFVEPVGQCGRRRLVDDALHFQPGNLPGIFRGLPLRVVKVSGHGDDRLGHFLAEVVFRRLLQLLQNQRGNLRRRVLLALRQHRDVVARLHDLIGHHLDLFRHFVEAPSHEALDRINRVLRIGDGLPLGHLPDQPFAGLGKSDHRRRSAPSFFIRDHFGLAALHDRHAGIGGPKVNSDNLAHKRLLYLRIR